MPTYPEIQEHKPGDAVDLSNIQYPISERFTSAFSNTYEHMQYNSVVNNLPHHIKPQEGYPGTFPMTEEDIGELKKDRPDLPNIPIGIPKFIGLATASIYDNDRNLALMEETKPSLMGRLAAWGGSIGASFLDIKAMIAAAATGGVGGRAAETIGKWGMTKLGASEIFGSKAANIGTQMAQSGVTFGAANVGYQGSRELQETETRDILQQPQHYVQSLQNMGMAGAQGFLLGVLGKGVGLSFFGRDVMRFKDGQFIDVPPAGKSGVYTPPEGENLPQFKHLEGQEWKADKEGGLLNRSEFNGMSAEQKKVIADNYKPWTANSDITMTEEATGQMMNGQVVNVDPIMKQGIADAGEDFRQAMRDNNIDLEALEGTLSEVHDNVKNDLSDAIKKSEDLRNGVNKPVISEKLNDGEIELFRGYNKTNIDRLSPERMNSDIEFGKGYWFAATKEHAAFYGKKVESIRGKYNIYDVESGKDADLNALYKAAKKAANEFRDWKEQEHIREFEDGYFDKWDELKDKRADATEKLREAAKAKGYQGLSRKEGYADDYGQATTKKGERPVRKPEIMFFDKPKSVDQIAFDENQKRIGELASHDFLINSLRDHINDTHEGATHADVRDYAQSLQSTGIPAIDNTATEFEPAPERDIDAYMREYEPEEIRSIAEKVNDENYNKELERAADRIKNIPKMREMTKNMTDCLMKGAE